MDIITIIFSVIILVISVMFHELAHGFAADSLGDPTPSLAGRLTLNPVAHMELVGSVLLPLLCIISGTGFVIGWAKPVPYNPNHLSSRRWGPALVAAAGPAINIVIALVGAVVFRFVGLPVASTQIIVMIVAVNISLAVFNLIPVPPLDGHHILGSIVPAFRRFSDRLTRSYGIAMLIVVVLFAGWLIGPLIRWVLHLLLGI